MPPAIDRNLVFVPALSGLACPHWDRRAAGLWVGLSHDTNREDVMQSILEGVALRTQEVVRAMSSLTEIGDHISIDGGLCVNPYFCQFLADSLGKTVTVNSFTEITAIGTAQLAGAKPTFSDEDDQLKRYSPREFRQDRIEKFTEAVSRSMKWRNAEQ